MAAPARPTLPLTRRARLPRSGGPTARALDQRRPSWRGEPRRRRWYRAPAPAPAPAFNALRGSEQLDHTKLSYLPACPLACRFSHSLSLAPPLALSPSALLAPFPSSSSSTAVYFFYLPTYLPTCALGMRKTDLPSALIPRPALRAPYTEGPPRAKGPGIS